MLEKCRRPVVNHDAAAKNITNRENFLFILKNFFGFIFRKFSRIVIFPNKTHRKLCKRARERHDQKIKHCCKKAKNCNIFAYFCNIFGDFVIFLFYYFLKVLI